MATKTIKTNVTLHVPDKDHAPFKITKEGYVEAGNYSIKAHAPGTEVTLDAGEADAILARHGGEEVKAQASAK